MTRSRRVRIVALCAGMVVLASTPVGAMKTDVLDDAQLAGAVLTPEEVPGDGWALATSDVSEGQPNTQARSAIPGWCGNLTDSDAADDRAVAGSAVTTLQRIPGPDDPYWFVWETLWSFSESGKRNATQEARAFLSAIQDGVDGCKEEGWVDFGGLRLTPREIAFAKVGNQRIAFHVTTPIDGAVAEGFVVYVRVANNVVVVHARILPPDKALLTSIVKRAVKRLKETTAPPTRPAVSGDNTQQICAEYFNIISEAHHDNEFADLLAGLALRATNSDLADALTAASDGFARHDEEVSGNRVNGIC